MLAASRVRSLRLRIRRAGVLLYRASACVDGAVCPEWEMRDAFCCSACPPFLFLYGSLPPPSSVLPPPPPLPDGSDVHICR